MRIMKVYLVLRECPICGRWAVNRVDMPLRVRKWCVPCQTIRDMPFYAVEMR